MRAAAANGGDAVRVALEAVATAVAALLLCVPAASSAEIPTNCFWPLVYVDDPSGGNLFFPDLGASYWQTQVKVPDGAHIEIAHQFPFSRYMSYTSYSEGGIPTAKLTDIEMQANPGNVNPFLPGADRTATDRSYRIRILNEPEPDQPAEPNTLYAGIEGKSSIDLIYRIYVEDDGLGFDAGVGVPEMELHRADGSVVTGQDACDELMIDPDFETPPGGIFPEELYRGLVSLGRLRFDGLAIAHPAVDPAFWYKAWNVLWNFLPFFKGTPLEVVLPFAPIEGQVDQFANLDNDYLVGYVDLHLGPRPNPMQNVYVVRGKGWDSPRTREGDPIMGEGDIRYWSWCMNEAAVTTVTPACVIDEDIPLDVAGNYVLVTGKEAMRPWNARPECGFAWIPFSPDGDGLDRPFHGLYILRNMLPTPGFDQTIQSIPDQNSVEDTLGPYFPQGEYMSVAEFEALGCPAQPPAPSGRVTICHNGTRTLAVPPQAVRAHLDHGDTLGACLP